MTNQKPKARELMGIFENLYPDEFSEEYTAMMNQTSARIMKVAEQFNATAIMERKYGSLHVEAESKYAEGRIKEEANIIAQEEAAQMLARMQIKLLIRQTQMR